MADSNTVVAANGNYVILDLSTSTAANNDTANTIVGYTSPSVDHFNIISNNTYIKGIILPNTLTSIGSHAFSYCDALTSVTIPGSITSIGTSAFYNCGSLTTVTFGAESTITTRWNNNAFSGSTNTSSYTGTSLWNVYNTDNKPGTYTRTYINSTYIWTKQQ